VPQFSQDPNEVTAEQHALDNPGHIVIVRVSTGIDSDLLDLTCQSCDWWDEQLFRKEEA
jgi:hypothetical protein